MSYKRDAKRVYVAGRTGSGKSSLIMGDLIGPRTIIVDPKGDYKRELPKRSRVVIYTDDGWRDRLLKTLAERWGKGFCIVLDTTGAANGEAVTLALWPILQKVQARYAAGHDGRKITLILEEMSFIMPPGNLAGRYGPLLQMIRTGREWGIEMIGITQTPSSVSRDYRGNCAEVYLFPIGVLDPRGQAMMRESLPDEWRPRYDDLPAFHYLHVTNDGVEMRETKPLRTQKG